MGSEDGEAVQTLDFQMVEDTVQSALAFLGNIATQFSVQALEDVIVSHLCGFINPRPPMTN